MLFVCQAAGDNDGNNARTVVVVVEQGVAVGGALRIDGDDFSAATPHHQYSLQTLG